MTEPQKPKTTLLGINPTKKETPDTTTGQIEYKQVSNMNDYIGELSDQQKQAEFNQKHQQYIKMKQERKKELIRLKKEEFGTSSSEDNADSSEEEIQSDHEIKKIENKPVKAQVEQKEQSGPQNNYPMILQLKKTTVERQLQLHEKDFQINNRTFQYVKITKLGMSKGNLHGRNIHKMRIGIGTDEGVISLNDKFDKADHKMVDIFMRVFGNRMDSSSFKGEKSRCNPQEFGELREGALICDKIYKKSQVFGKWEERYVIVRPEGLYSYKNLKEKPTMEIPLVQITELLTNFEWYKQTLVVKLFYNGTKTDFGLPLDEKLSWMSRFVGLLQ